MRYKGIIIFACACAAVAVISLVVVFKGAVFEKREEQSAGTDTVYETPQREERLSGQMTGSDKSDAAGTKEQGDADEEVTDTEADHADKDVSGTKEGEASKGFRNAYQVFLDDWKRIEEYGDFSYLALYFGEDRYYFDRYFLCDVDENGIPELFLNSSYMLLTAVFTYSDDADKPVFLMYENIYGINRETDEAVIHGHWHGSGGSWEDEWAAYHISSIPWEYSMYIDFMDFSEEDGGICYDIYDPGKDEYTHPEDGAEYDALYAAHVKPCVLFEDFRLYDLSDVGGLEDVQ